MIYKIKIYKHNSVKANIDDDIIKMVDYFKSPFVKSFINGGFDIQTTIEITNIPKQEVIQKLFLTNKGKCDFVMYVYENGLFDPLVNNAWGLTQSINNLQCIMLKSDIPSDNVDYTWKAMAHEVLHAITYKILQDKNIPFSIKYNFLDSPLVNGKVVRYYGNENLTLSNGNFAQQLYAIAPLINKPLVTIIRRQSNSKETLGSLHATINCIPFNCYTLELPDLNNAQNISCIPKGTYTVKWTFSPRFLKYTYEVQNVPNRSGIRIHAGNYYKDFNGCIGLGSSVSDINGDKIDDITNSKVTIEKFEKLLNKREFVLEIK